MAQQGRRHRIVADALEAGGLRPCRRGEIAARFPDALTMIVANHALIFQQVGISLIPMYAYKKSLS